MRLPQENRTWISNITKDKTEISKGTGYRYLNQEILATSYVLRAASPGTLLYILAIKNQSRPGDMSFGRNVWRQLPKTFLGAFSLSLWCVAGLAKCKRLESEEPLHKYNESRMQVVKTVHISSVMIRIQVPPLFKIIELYSIPTCCFRHLIYWYIWTSDRHKLKYIIYGA